MKSDQILNFTWHIPDQLATGGKPSYPEQLAWLKEQGFTTILSLEDIPDPITTKMLADGISRLLVDLDDADEFDIDLIDQADWQQISSFIKLHVERGNRVFVHCSAGAKRSPAVVRRFLRETQP